MSPLKVPRAGFWVVACPSSSLIDLYKSMLRHLCEAGQCACVPGCRSKALGAGLIVRESGEAQLESSKLSDRIRCKSLILLDFEFKTHCADRPSSSGLRCPMCGRLHSETMGDFLKWRF